MGKATVWRWVFLIGVLAAPCAADAPAEYRFAAGDTVEITITPQRGFDRTVMVQPDGKISYPMAGELQAAGLTIQQLSTHLRERLVRELVDPQVSISLREQGQRPVGRVSVLGAVRSPGGYEIRPGASLADVLAAAGGPAALADLRRVTITRSDQMVSVVDLAESEKSGRVEGNVPLQAGDIVVVPEGARPTVLVLGAVAKPGSYDLPQDARLLDALSLAGGTTERADLARVMVTPQEPGGTRTLNLLPLLAQGDTSNPELNVLLQPGDTLFIAEIAQQIYVLGAVAKPGLYPIKPNDRVMDVLVTAGGAGAAAKKAALVRNNAQGQPVRQNLDLKKIMARGDAVENVVLRSGDVLYVSDNNTSRRTSTGLILDNVLKLAAIMALF